MIIRLKKFLFIGASEEIDRFFSRAQHKGIIEFISPHGRKPVELPPEVEHLLEAMRILRKLPLKKPYDRGGDLQFADDTALRIAELKAEVEKLAEERRLLETEIFRVAPFGDFSMEDLDYLQKEAHRTVQFFCAKTGKVAVDQLQDNMIYIGTEYDLDYFIAVSKEPKIHPEMIEMRIDRPLGELQMHLSFVKESLHQIEAELKGYAGHIDFLNEALVERLNDHNLIAAKKDVAFPLDHNLFAVEAWVPENKITVLYGVLDGMAIHAEQIVIEKEDRIPTYMENKGVKQIGEDLVRIYDIPAHTDKDPSGWVFAFFALFFSMIVADGGYGALYFILCIYLRFKHPEIKGFAKRFLKLATILSICCIAWGFLTAEFFGLEINPKSWLGKISVVQELAVRKADYHLAAQDQVYKYWVNQFPSLAQVQSGKQFLEQGVKITHDRTKYVVLDQFSDTILLEFSLIIGVVHISLSLLRYLLRRWAGIGWVAFLVGGYLYFPTILKATTLLHILGLVGKVEGAEFGLQLIYSGIASAVFLGVLQKRLKGFGELTSVLQVFADVLSYLRLYALGLAGSILASTFNDIGRDIGLFFGTLVVLAGHGVNITLGLMAGMIHGLRLNFIEWYHYSFEGGGRLFRPLMRLKAKEHI